MLASTACGKLALDCAASGDGSKEKSKAAFSLGRGNKGRGSSIPNKPRTEILYAR